jgi:hypothetical protein
MINRIQKALGLFILSAFLISCVASGSNIRNDSGTFRGRWYNYYDRGLLYSASGDWDSALHDLRKASAKRDRDQRMARTYGMHFIDYFPHREVGIALFHMGNIDEAIRELETSLSQEKSAKASFYLNKARKIFLQQEGRVIAPPIIVIHTPVDNESLNSFTKRVKGKVSGKGYVAKITINGIPYRFDLAEQEISFEMNVDITEGTNRIVVTAEDLLGMPSLKTVAISIDREGPAISIFDIVEEGSSNTVRITGTVNDATGISKLLINNRAVPVKDSGVHDFDVVLNRASLPSPFVIHAYDRLNNVTRAELDIEKELTAMYRNEEPLLLAFTGTDLFSSDTVPPVISLKDSREMPPVFVDKYYVEGEVSDNRKVEQIIVNKADIFSRKGKKIFFSKLVRLKEGTNGIDIEAFDSSGNRADTGFIVTRTIPEVLQVGSRMSMSIMPFDRAKEESAVEMLAYEQLTGSFVSQKRFNVIEREKLEQVLLEQKLTREKLTDPEYSIKVGRLMAADTILSTSLAVDQKSVEFTSRVINTETSQIMEVKDVYSEDSSSASIKQMMDGLAAKFAGSFPLVEGMVIKRENNVVYTDLGKRTGIKSDMGIIIYREGEEIRHPLTGKYLGRDMENLGAAEIEEVQEDFSKARLNDRNTANGIKVQDMVITR